MKSVGYVCVTGVEEIKGPEALIEQESLIKQYAQRAGLELTKVYRDNGVQGGPPCAATRGGLIQMLDDSTNGQFNTVLVATRVRLCRNEEIGFDIAEEIRGLGKDLVVVDEVPMPPVRPVEVLSESAGKGSGSGASARGFKDSRGARRNGRGRNASSAAEGSERRSAGKADGKRGREAARGRKSAAAGVGAGGARGPDGAGGRQNERKPMRAQSGPAPFGYVRERIGGRRGQSQLRPDPQEAESVRVIFREYLRRRSMKKLIDYLERENVSTRRGRRWSRAAIAWILKNDTYLGKVHAGGDRYRGAHEPIIAPIIFNKVQQLLRRNNKRRDRGSQVAVPAVANTKKAAAAGRKSSASDRQPSSKRQPAMAGAAG